MANENQGDVLAQNFPKDSIEYRLLVKYTQRKATTRSHLPQSNGVGEAKAASPEQPQGHRKQRKKKTRSLLRLIGCVRPVKEDDVPVREHHRRRAATDSCPDQEEEEEIVNKLTKIADSVHFSSEEIESDSNDLVERIVELLREHGDKLNEEIEKNHTLRNQLQATLSYGFFMNVVKAFMQRLSPDELSPAQSPQQAKVALTCELTYHLNAMDCHPMNRVLGFGAKYLQDHFSPWVKQQGGYGKVFGTDGDAEEEVE